MTKREREQMWNDYVKRGPRELADLLLQSEEHIEKQDRKIAILRRAAAKAVAEERERRARIADAWHRSLLTALKRAPGESIDYSSFAQIAREIRGAGDRGKESNGA